ncbi:anaphase-promoting complex subunit 1, partial [Plakobranchus ocellatus]
MITSSETQDFVPFGRDYIRHHPGQFQVKRICGPPTKDLAVPLAKSFKDISLHEHFTKESWVFRQHTDTTLAFDEELYVQGPTVVWSRGGQDGVRTVVKTFTMDATVQQALWGTFVLASGDHAVDCRSTMGSSGKEQQGVCVVTSDAINFFLESGGEYLTSLPFQVSHTWKIKNGLLFERSLTPAERTVQKKNCPSQTVIFSLLHPLDDVAPVITRISSPKAPPKELDQLGPAWDANTSLLHNMTPLHSNNNGTSNNCSNNPSNLSSSFSSRQISGMSAIFPPGVPHSASTSSSPLRGFSGKVMSPSGIMRSSPGVGALPMTPGASGFMRSSPGVTVSRPQQSPSTSAGALASVSAPAFYRFHTPSPAHQQGSTSRCSPGRLMSPGPSHHSGMWGGLNESIYGPDPALSIQPNICMELIWTEAAPPIRDGQLGKASKAFLTEDLCGQQFLCFLVPYKQQLRCLKFEESNDGSQLIFGSVSCLHAKDATPIESQRMLLVLEVSGVLVLYSGVVKMSQVHIPVLPMGSGSISVLRSATTPMGSPTRGGEVFTSSRPPSAMDARFDEQMTHISPVSANLEDSTGPLSSPLGPGGLGGGAGGMVTPGNSFIQNLRDNVGNKFSVELLNGSMFRTELPVMTDSPGIDLSLRCLKHLLPKDIALQLMARWYTTRNSPGVSGSISEWTMFTTCLLNLMGYDTTKLGLTAKERQDSPSSPLMLSKRARPSEKGADEDWGYMLGTKHHQHSLSSIQVLKLLPASLTSGSGGPESGRVDLDDGMNDHSHRFSRPCAINTSAPLFPFCPAVLLALHMAYEEVKLNVLLQEELTPFAPLIHQIACDLRCESYADYYRRDFPRLFGEVDDLSQISEEDLHKMQYPQIFPSTCPTVLGWIHLGMSISDPPAMPYIPGLYAILVNKGQPADLVVERSLKKIAPAGHRAPTAEMSFSFARYRHSTLAQGYLQAAKLVMAMAEMGITQRTLDSLPMGVALPLREACLMCRPYPPPDWPLPAYKLTGRQDMHELVSLTHTSPSYRPPQSAPEEKEEVEKDDYDGMEHLDEEVLRLRFPRDLRLKEVRKLLQSSRPVPITIKQLPEVSDHYFMEKQEKVLLAICIRTMALPVGRGIFTLHTCQPLLTETLPIPKLCLTGRAPPRNTTVDLNRVDAPANMSVWPKFHNGVAAGLRIADTTQVDSAWIIYNRPKELNNEFAGFLMALGLNGHLPNLSTFNIHEYISE